MKEDDKKEKNIVNRVNGEDMNQKKSNMIKRKMAFQ